METVIILSESDDIHALAVKKEVEKNKNVACQIVNTADFPSKLSLSNYLNFDDTTHEMVFDDSRLSTIEFKDIIGVWRRRIFNHKISEELDQEIYQEVSRRDTRASLDGFLLTLALKGCNVINNPTQENASLNKTFQLFIAQRCGICVPRTVISNNPPIVKKFYSSISNNAGKVVYKAFHSPKNSVITTNFLTEADFDRLDDLRFAPAIFQEYIDGRNLRITYINGDIFSAEVFVNIPEATRDWRLEMFNKIVEYELQPKDKFAITSLMKALKLEYGAIDFKINKNNELVFLEVNPWGQFLFVEIQTGLPISKAIADALISKHNKH